MAVEMAEQVRIHLLEQDGTPSASADPYVKWQVQVSNAFFIYYERKGTLWSPVYSSLSPAIKDAWSYIDSLAGPPFMPTDRPWMLGTDESGRGEFAGHLFLVGALVPASLAELVEDIVGLAETKTRHTPMYWERLFSKLEALRGEGLDFQVAAISPDKIDERKLNHVTLNQLMDEGYRKLLDGFLEEFAPSQLRIVVDNYGVGPEFRQFLNDLRTRGAESLWEHGADDRYLEARVASVVAGIYRARELVLRE